MGKYQRLVICLMLLLPLLHGGSAPAGKAYIWRDKDGGIHFSDSPPLSDEVGSRIEEREFKEPEGQEKAKAPEARSPVERAVQSTFRLRNKRGGASGFFISSTGLAITARHVVQGITYSMKAEVPGEKERFRVRVLKKSRKYDLALLRVSIRRPVNYLEIRDPWTLVPGEEVWAVGNPLLAFRETVTKGIFSRIFLESDWKTELKMKRPPFKFRGDWVQFSAPIIGGNSGGPLVDKQGRVIGVVSLGNTMHRAINFAVPSTYIREEFASYLE
ncbi:MAG: trypsin-like peptidase domain-containing protein [Deltaproteobacteria bacterium]|nr:trypsin-like peptidase domain-containing protein [Deltaproteobacteria bacterium]